MTFAQRRDANEPEIVAGLEDNGYLVERAYRPMPFDLLVGRRGSPVRLPLEVKTANGKLRDTQSVYFADFPVLVVRTVQEAIYACEKYL